MRRNVFADKASLIPRMMLCDPDRKWVLRDLGAFRLCPPRLEISVRQLGYDSGYRLRGLGSPDAGEEQDHL